jgi:XTP/dITP diphosphohydrolase
VRLLIATRSAHKLDEIRSILGADGPFEVISLDDVDLPPDPPDDELEPFDTFEANALSKARWYGRHSGLITVADDSGLEVDALDGAPGVRSKRFAPGDAVGAERDAANNRHLLERLSGIPEAERTARYVCAVALVDPAGREEMLRGTVEGRILEAPAGQGGFGYDPLFYVPDLDRTFAQASPAEKHARSHRGRAFRALADRLNRDEP